MYVTFQTNMHICSISLQGSQLRSGTYLIGNLIGATSHRAKESHLTDFLMSEADAAEIHKRAVRYMMQYMVSAFATFSDLKQFVTDEVPSHPVVKTEIVPMKVFFQDESMSVRLLRFSLI